MRGALLRSYAGQVKIFLVLLVVFLAVAIFFNVDLLVVARNAIQDEAGQRLGVEADLVRVELERDQMLRGLQAAAGEAPYIPPTFLDRLARLHDMVGIDILRTDGTVLTSSDPGRIGQADPFLLERDGRERRRLLSGWTALAPLQRLPGSRYATLSAYRPVRDRRLAAVAFIRVERQVPILASVDFDLKTIATLQAGGLVVILVLVLLFARWLLQPYRRLQRAAGQAAVPLPSSGPEARDEADALVGAFQGVLDKLRDQEGELQALKSRAVGAGSSEAAPEARLIAGMSSAALVFDAGGRLSNLNAAAGRLLGLDRRAAAGKRFDALLQGNDRLVDLIRASFGTGEGRSREVVPLLGAGSRTTHLGVMLSPIRAQGPEGEAGPVDGLICLLTDLTEIRSLRERVRLKENLASLGELSAGIAHEFRNSLAAIQGYARLAARAATAGGSREHAESILREVGGIQKVVGDFLRYARPQTPDLQEVDLQAMGRDLAADFRADKGHAGIELLLEGSFPPIAADETLLRQALQNLLRNAAEALEAGSGVEGGGPAEDAAAPGPLLTGGPRIILRAGVEAGERGRVRIEVEDNGTGIPASDLPHIFTPFFTTRPRGTGLGLALVQKTAIVHDGEVEVTSDPGRSTRIALLLPRRPGLPAAADLVA
ncbi:MAG TPA: ATP-binding protein [Candidatus Cryosericum sp.]|nr:ATP-binding protein [Candidatus Cryosericum sp.]